MRSAQTSTAPITGFLAAWQQLLHGEFIPSLVKRCGGQTRVPLTQLLPTPELSPYNVNGGDAGE